MKPVSLQSTAVVNGGGIKQPFNITKKLSFISNDSSTYDMNINFDGSTSENGTFTLKAGESLSDLEMTCTSISVEGINGSVAFRALGV